MTVGIEFQWAVCPEGAAIVDHGPGKPTPAGVTVLTGELRGRWLTNRTKNLVGYRRHLTDLKSGTMLESFINADTDEKLLAFVSEFGMVGTVELDHKESAIEGPREYQAAFKRLFDHAGQGEQLQAIEVFNSISASAKGTALKPSLSLPYGQATPIMTFTPKTPYGYMLMEASMAISNATELRTCQHCGTAFFAGALTSKRTNAYYCSNRCRVAAQRAAAKV
jgi:hypothetical protein